MRMMLLVVVPTSDHDAMIARKCLIALGKGLERQADESTLIQLREMDLTDEQLKTLRNPQASLL